MPRRKQPIRLPERTTQEEQALYRRVTEELFHSDRAFFDTLSAPERAAVVRWVQDTMERGDPSNSPVFSTLWEADYTSPPVSIEVFITDNDYLGASLNDIQDCWYDDLNEVFKPGSQVFEWLFTGGIGVGKTTIAMAAIAYTVYRMSLLRSPQSYYGLLPDSRIVFGIYSITKKQTSDTGFFKLRGFVDRSPYFRHSFRRRMELDSALEFPSKLMHVVSGCVAEGTLIATPNGDVPVERISQAGKSIMAMDGQTFGLIPTPFTRVDFTGEKDCLDLKTESGHNLCCSLDHRVMVVDDDGCRYVQAKDLRVGQFVLVEESASTEPVEGVYEVPEATTGVVVQDADNEAHSRRACVPAVPLSALREQDCAGVVSRQPRVPQEVRQGEAVVQGVQGCRAGEMGGVLREEPHPYFGQNVQARESCTGEGADQEVAEGKPGQGEGKSASDLCSHAEGSDCREVAEVGEDREGAVGQERRRASSPCDEEGVGCVAYPEGHQVDCACVRGSVLLLPTGGENAGQQRRVGDVGSHCSHGARGQHTTAKSGSLLPFVQQRQGQAELVLSGGEEKFALGESRVANRKVRPVRISSITPAGRRRTYDVINSACPTHSIVSGGIVSSNSQDLHAIGQDVYSACVVGDTLVATASGPVKISELVESPRRIWTWNGARYLTDSPLHAIRTGTRKVVTVRTAGGQAVTCTPDHRFMTSNRGWVAARDLRIGVDSIVAFPSLGNDLPIVVAVGEESTAEVFDLVNVPNTHLFFAGSNPDAPFCAIHNSVDEVNFMRAKVDAETGRMAGQAYDLYDAVRNRMLTRFLRPGGTMPGLVMLLSSRKIQTSFLEGRINEVTGGRYRPGMRGQIGPNTFLSDYALWEAKSPDKFSKKTFSVAIGNRYFRSRILQEGEQAPVGMDTIKVPDNLRPDFDRNLDQAIRDLAGRPTVTISPLIHDIERIHGAVRGTFRHPFKGMEVTASLNSKLTLISQFTPDACCRVVRSRWVPQMNPGRRRFLHVDIGLTNDSLGIAMGHASGDKVVTETLADGSQAAVRSPCIIIDFCLRVVPIKGTEIDLEKVRAFIIYLSGIYRIAMVSYDGYQSRGERQMLVKRNLSSKIVSLDESAEPYLALAAAIAEGRLFYYRYPRLLLELTELRHDVGKHKVDHPERFADGERGSKDVADAVCGVVWGILSDPDPFMREGKTHDPDKIDTTDNAQATVTELEGVSIADLDRNLR